MARCDKTLVLRRPAQVNALASPMRARIVDALAGGAPSSIRELAEAFGVRPESLYYHIRTLQKHGLVVERSKRKHKRRHEAVYALTAPRLKLDRTQRSPRYLDAVVRTCELMLRATARDYRAALRTAGNLAAHAPGALSVRRLVAGLDREGLNHLSQLLRQIDALFDRYPPRRCGQVQSLTIVLVPLQKPNRE
jgi:DNA-binding transcriptional ArsR family regulator